MPSRSAQSSSNVLRLAAAQALAGANTTVVYATAAIIGEALAPSKSLATLPISVFVVGMAASTLPAGAVAQRHGRRAAFMLGTLCGVLLGLLAALGIYLESFALFCAAMAFGGAYAAVVLTFRFAAAECVEPHRKARALSTVLAGGVLAGVLRRPARAAAAGGRPLRVIARQPRFIAAVVCGVVTYMLMNFLMTSAPLAMRMHGLSQHASNLGVQWHVIAMYAPSFVAGGLITRYGAVPVVAAGLLLTAAAAVVGLAGMGVWYFWVSLTLLGVGWNFGFAGASAMVLECHLPQERTRVQAANDFIIFGTMVVGSFVSGDLLMRYGWEVVCWLALPPLAVAAFALRWFKPLPAGAAGSA
ncbi:putative membrane protein [Bordetella bronchiseptica MO211]|nr:putative membrane protein [Bordetella bronchiseptica MO211]